MHDNALESVFARHSNCWCAMHQVVEAKLAAVKDGFFEEAALLRTREIDLQIQISGPAEDCAVVPVVDVGDVEAIVASWSGVPVEKLSAEDEQKFISLVRRMPVTNGHYCMLEI